MKKTIVFLSASVFMLYFTVITYHVVNLISTDMFTLYNLFAFSLPHLIILSAIVFVSTAYFLPTLIALALNSKSKTPIVLLNALFGWSFIGWVAALVMSIVNRDQKN